MKPPPVCYAVVPAAGRSTRMGPDHKLLLPWEGATVIDRVLQAWTESRVRRVIVVMRGDDAPLQAVCRKWPGVDIVTPELPPEDMKRSIQLGLRQIEEQFDPGPTDRWLVAPADLPTLGSGLINQLIDASGDSDQIVAPRFGQSPGHPVSFPWSLVPDVFQLDRDQGINRLVESHPTQWLALPASQRPEDIDTPADYFRLSKRQP